MAILNTRRAVIRGLAMALMLDGAAIGLATAQTVIAAPVIADNDRAPHLYPMALPGTLGCVDDAYNRVTWGCD
jgi:hypothetical protein